MADVKIQAVTGPNIDPNDVDFRGAGRKGAGEGDHHRTLAEVRVPDEDAEAWIEKARAYNEVNAEFFGLDGVKISTPIGDVGPGKAGIYMRVFDND